MTIAKKITTSALISTTTVALIACTGNYDVNTENNASDVNAVDNVNTESIVGVSDVVQDGKDKVLDEVNLVSSSISEIFGSSSSLLSSFDNSAVDTNPPIVDGKNIYTVDACDLNGNRFPHAQVDVGYGDREYWGYTNAYGQLVGVYADEIILQTKDEENSRGRYCHDEAKVPGVESPVLDEGHVIGDALGGVSNAYNITPQDSNLNRNGGYYRFEREIQGAGGARNFSATIEYPNNSTQIPSKYIIKYTLPNGVTRNYEFING